MSLSLFVNIALEVSFFFESDLSIVDTFPGHNKVLFTLNYCLICIIVSSLKGLDCLWQKNLIPLILFKLEVIEKESRVYMLVLTIGLWLLHERGDHVDFIL